MNKMPKPRSPVVEKNHKEPKTSKVLKDSTKKPKESKESKESKERRYTKKSTSVENQSRDKESFVDDDTSTDEQNFDDEFTDWPPPERFGRSPSHPGATKWERPSAAGVRSQGPQAVPLLVNYQNKNGSPYPEAIAKLIEMSLMEVDKVREAFKGRNRQNYVRIFQAYKDNLTERDYSIIRGATGYLYENSRMKSINEDTALWMLGIHEIPASQIQCYTSKPVLEKIAKDCGLSNSGKKAEVLIQNIRSVIDSSK